MERAMTLREPENRPERLHLGTGSWWQRLASSRYAVAVSRNKNGHFVPCTCVAHAWGWAHAWGCARWAPEWLCRDCGRRPYLEGHTLACWDRSRGYLPTRRNVRLSFWRTTR